MGIRERDRKVYRPLWRAGLEVIPNAVPDGTMPFVLGYGAEEVAGGFSHRYDTPRLVERLNELHDGSHAAPAVWTRVRLLERWDIMGRGAASAFLGVHAGHPGFAMMALDSSVYVRASTGEIGVDVLAVPHPDRSENILRHLERITFHDSPYVNREFRERIAVWLAARARSAVSPSGR